VSVRAFVSVGLPSEVIGAMLSAQARMRLIGRRLPVRWSRPAAMHLTLRFLGDVPEDVTGPLGDAVRAACAPVAPFVLETATLGCFPSPESARVVWLGLGGETDGLERLARVIAAATAPFVTRQEDRVFVPHLTLGRIGEARRGDLELLAKGVASVVPERVVWRVGSARLMRSNLRAGGAEHVLLAECPLLGAKTDASDGRSESP